DRPRRRDWRNVGLPLPQAAFLRLGALLRLLGARVAEDDLILSTKAVRDHPAAGAVRLDVPDVVAIVQEHRLVTVGPPGKPVRRRMLGTIVGLALKFHAELRGQVHPLAVAGAEGVPAVVVPVEVENEAAARRQ